MTASLILSPAAYRHVFERGDTYEDQFVKVASLKQVLGEKFVKLSWPQFVEMIIHNELENHGELVELGQVTATADKDGQLRAVKDVFNNSRAAAAGRTVNEPDVWVANHWAPYWFTCGLCLPELRPEATVSKLVS